eukprot:Skav203438  [mRNA]  locus=scaffold1836:265307:269464:+ [translate_table: standard]
MKPRKPQKLQPKQAPCRARKGDYEPPCETYNVAHTQMVKQMRRLQALTRRMQKWEHQFTPQHVENQNWSEWFAILFADAFRPSFPLWCLQWNLVDHWYHDLPPVWWLRDLCKALHLTIDGIIRRAAEFRRRHFRFKVDVDQLHFGGAIVAAAVKHGSKPRPVAFQVEDSCQATLTRSAGKCKPTVTIPRCNLDVTKPAQINGSEVKLSPLSEPDTFSLNTLPSGVGAHFEITQKTMSNSPDRVAAAFFEFWAPFWLRDDEHAISSVEPWETFLGFVRSTPQLDVECDDSPHTLAEWTFAISKTKPETSRGSCGFSQPEFKAMHPRLLTAFIDVINKLGQLGFPEWLMMAFVYLVPKTSQAVEIAAMRPITVFSLTFRLWSKVVVRRLMLQWKRSLPAAIVGGVSGRSCSQLSLSNSLKVERKLQVGCEAGGFSLDIEKCFNGFGRVPLVELLRYHGMGTTASTAWLHSLQRMSRCAVLLDSVSEAQYASTGLAEGDPLSVCGMIAVGLTWYRLIVIHADADPTVFADDWNWSASQPSQHVRALKLTIQFLQSLRLNLDPKKSWCWGTSPAARKAWLDINNEVVGSPMYFRIAHAEKVLGVFMHFAKTTHHGCLGVRLDEGIKRLERLSRLALPLKQAARAIQSTIWPMTLFGCDIVYVGKRHFSRLRSIAAGALLKKTGNTNVHLAFSALTTHVDDPFLYALLKSLCIWRRLLTTDETQRDIYLNALIASSDNPNHAHGPAGALKCYLACVGWSIDEHGDIIDHLHRCFSLISTPTGVILSRIRDAWDAVVTDTIRTRHGYENWPEFDLKASANLKLPEDNRQAANTANLRCVGALFGNQREQWQDSDVWDFRKCPLCGESDSRAHFPYNCTAIADLRAEFDRTIQIAVLEFPHCCLIPVVHKHPKLQVVTYLHSQREMPAPFDLCDFGDFSDCTPHFFTDGSAAFPKMGGHLAGWSIVLDTLHDDAERAAAVQALHSYDTDPTSLMPIQVSLVAGVQTINRAEIQAIYQIFRSCNHAVIYTDSQWSIDRVIEIQENPDPACYTSCEHSDILVAICHLAMVKPLSEFRLVKIKSHQNIAQLDSWRDIYAALGNRFADKMAKRAVSRDASPLHTLCWQIAEWYTQQTAILRDLQIFLATAEAKRLDAFDHGTNAQRFEREGRFSVEHAIIWDPPLVLSPSPSTVPDFLLECFTPSPGSLKLFLEWAALLRWPSADDFSGGISWYELLVNFVYTTGCRIPAILERGQSLPAYRDHAVHFDACLQHQTVWDHVRFLEACVNFVKRFTGIEIFPLEGVGKKRWYLGMYGYQSKISGVGRRPALPCQLEHVAYLKTLVSASELAIPTACIDSPVASRMVLDLDLLPHKVRCQKYRALLYRVRTRGLVDIT